MLIVDWLGLIFFLFLLVLFGITPYFLFHLVIFIKESNKNSIKKRNKRTEEILKALSR
jgi:hypothetical protein